MARVGLKQLIGQARPRRGRWSTPWPPRSAAPWPSRTPRAGCCTATRRRRRRSPAFPCGSTSGTRSAGWPGRPTARPLAALLDHLVGQRGRAQGARRRGAAPLSRDQPDLQLLGEARRAARRRARGAPHAAGGAAPDRRHRRRDPAARRRQRRPDVGRRLRRRDAGARAASATAAASSARSPRAASARSSTTSTPTRGASPRTRRSKALIARAAQGRRAGDRRDRARQHGADGLHRRRAQAAEHAGAADGDGDRERAAVRADGAGGARARAAAGAAQGDGSGARQARKRARRWPRASRPTCFPPMPALPGYDLAARNRPARQCGGDYYDAIVRDRHAAAIGVLLCVADVAGKGLPAALVMSNMQATLRALLGRIAVAAGAGRAGERPAVRVDGAGEVRHRGARRSRAGHRRAPLRRRRPRRH